MESSLEDSISSHHQFSSMIQIEIAVNGDDMDDGGPILSPPLEPTLEGFFQSQCLHPIPTRPS